MPGIFLRISLLEREVETLFSLSWRTKNKTSEWNGLSLPGELDTCFQINSLHKASLALWSPLSNHPLAQQQKTSPPHWQRKKVGHPLESWTLFCNIMMTSIINPVDLTKLILTKLDWCLPEKHLFLIFLFRTPWFHWYQRWISHFYPGVW